MQLLRACVLWLLTAMAALADGLERRPTPDWVDDIPLPPDDPALRAEARDGVHYLLSDHQLRWQGETRLNWSRTATEVTDRAGLDLAATITFDYDPAFDRVALTRLSIWRDGTEIDLKDRVEAVVMRREERLEEGVIDGALTIYLQVPDVRLGDVVDYAVLREERPFVGAGERAVVSQLEWAVPVVLSRTVVAWPAGWPFHQAALPDRVSHFEGPLPDGATRHEWQRIGHVPPRAEDLVPPGDDPTARLRLSTDADWGAISAALTPYYAADYELGAWEDRVAAIAAASPDPETRALSALRMVQDELRYVSLSVGEGGYFARAPAEVVGSGFGDCKDKALLLAVMLRRLGIAAEVALTDSDAGAALPDEVPMLGAFDHMILRLHLDGQAHWVDPTATHQGGRFRDASATPPDYGWALPLTGPDQRGLEPLPVTAESLWTSEVVEQFRFTPQGLALTVRSTHQGGAADDLRRRWATSPHREVTEDYFAYYAGRYPGLRLQGEVRLTDDRAANRLEMTEDYLLALPDLQAGGLDAAFPLAAEDFASNLPDRLDRPRLLPMETGRPAVFRHRIELSGAAVDLIAPPALAIENAGFAYRREASVPGPGQLVLDWTFRRKGAVIPADQVAAFLAERGQVYDTTWLTWNLRP